MTEWTKSRIEILGLIIAGVVSFFLVGTFVLYFVLNPLIGSIVWRDTHWWGSMLLLLAPVLMLCFVGWRSFRSSSDAKRKQTKEIAYWIGGAIVACVLLYVLVGLGSVFLFGLD